MDPGAHGRRPAVLRQANGILGSAGVPHVQLGKHVCREQSRLRACVPVRDRAGPQGTPASPQIARSATLLFG